MGFDCDVNLEDARSLFDVREHQSKRKENIQELLQFVLGCVWQEVRQDISQWYTSDRMQELADIIEVVCYKLGVTVVSSRIVMCNVMVKHYEPLELLKIAAKIEMGIRVQYDRDDYPGMKIKFDYKDRELTGLMFSSGSILLAGCKSAEEIHALYNAIYKKILIYNK